MVALPRRVFVSSVGGGAGNAFGAEGAAAIGPHLAQLKQLVTLTLYST